MTKIMIVDDHILFREGLKAVLSLTPGFDVVAITGSMRESLELSLKWKPDIVLMDFYLSDGSGVQAATSILANQPNCKIIFLTLSEKDEDLFAAVRSGAKGFLSKCTPSSHLMDSIRVVQNGESALSPALTLRVMEELARTRPNDVWTDPRLSKLTEREMSVFRELAIGGSNQEIAQRLFVAENTVKCHVHSILTKLKLPDRKAAAQFARDFGLHKSAIAFSRSMQKYAVTSNQ